MSPDALHFARRIRLTVLAVVLFGMVGSAQAQSAPQPQAATAKKVLSIEDYARWRSISGQAISSDGKWVVYGLQFTNVPESGTKPVMHLRNLETNEEIEVANATGGTFSDDAHWLAYQVDPSGRGGGRFSRGRDDQAPQGRGGAARAPEEPARAELRNLATGQLRSWQNVQSFTFSSDSAHLLLRRRPATQAGTGQSAQSGAPGGAPSGAAARGSQAQAARGVDVIMHDLASGRDMLLGRVGESEFDKSGGLLAYTVDTDPKDGNGLFLLDLTDDRLHTLDNDAKTYNHLTWNEEGTSLAVLKGEEVKEKRESANVLVVYPDVRRIITGKAAPVVFDPAGAPGFPADWVVSDRAGLNWSKDNTRIFFGMKPQVPEEPTRSTSPDSTADVDVWNTIDERIQSEQMRQENSDRNRTYQEAFEIKSGRFIKLADETMRDLEVAPEGKWAIGRDQRGLIKDYGPTLADLYRVDTTTGERTLILDDQIVSGGALGFSSDGRYYLYWKDNHYQAWDLDRNRSATLGGAHGDVFVDLEDDHPGPKSPYGIAGYTEDGKGLVATARYDLWFVPFDGSDARNLTGGRGDQDEIRFRYVDLNPESRAGGFGGRGGRGSSRRKIDLSKPITLTAYGEWTKKAGFYELARGRLREIVYEDASFSTPTKAAKADKYLFTRQTFVEYPDLRISGPDFSKSTKITDANPQQAEYRWGHRVLFDFQNKDGLRLQGILALPDDYQAGQKRPMLVTFYEKNSQNMHRYNAPSYLSSMGSSPMQAVSEGYITMLPDIHFRTGASHSDMLECVEAAVHKVIEMGYVDTAHIGINGHSYGGEGAAFIGTRSRLFAAVGMGAGVTDLYYDFNQNWGWSYQVDGGSGANGHQYYLFSQGREAVTPWDATEMYLFESAITHVPEVTAPFLIMHGTADPTVSFFQGLGMYNALRYLNKPAALLAYRGEGHGLRNLANRKDLTIRFFQFFDHYLLGQPAPKWLTEGVTLLEKEAGEGVLPPPAGPPRNRDIDR